MFGDYVMTDDKEASTIEKLKFLYEAAKLTFFNDQKLVGKHVTDTDQKEFLRYVAEMLFSKTNETPEVHVGYSSHREEDGKELYLRITTENRWERRFLGRVKERGCSGVGQDSCLVQKCSEADLEE